MIEINLFPWRETVKRTKRNRMLFSYASIFLFFCMIFLSSHCYLRFKIKKLHHQIIELERHSEVLREVIPRAFYYLDSVLTEKIQIFDMMNNLFHLPESTITVNEMSYKKGLLLIKGIAVTVADVDRFMMLLLAMNKAQAIRLNGLKQSGLTWEYELQLTDFTK